MNKRSPLVLMSIFLLILMSGCANYFKITHVVEPLDQKIDGFGKDDKVIILHFEDKMWILDSSSVSDNVLKGMIAKEDVSSYPKTIKYQRANRYKKRVQSNLLKQVHIYATELTRLPDSSVSVPLSGIQKIELYEKDHVATTVSYILGGFGIAAVITTAGIIYILSVMFKSF